MATLLGVLEKARSSDSTEERLELLEKARLAAHDQAAQDQLKYQINAVLSADKRGDVDYANDMLSQIITRVSSHPSLAKKKIEDEQESSSGEDELEPIKLLSRLPQQVLIVVTFISVLGLTGLWLFSAHNMWQQNAPVAAGSTSPKQDGKYGSLTIEQVNTSASEENLAVVNESDSNESSQTADSEQKEALTQEQEVLMEPATIFAPEADLNPSKASAEEPIEGSTLVTTEPVEAAEASPAKIDTAPVEPATAPSSFELNGVQIPSALAIAITESKPQGVLSYTAWVKPQGKKFNLSDFQKLREAVLASGVTAEAIEVLAEQKRLLQEFGILIDDAGQLRVPTKAINGVNRIFKVSGFPELQAADPS